MTCPAELDRENTYTEYCTRTYVFFVCLFVKICIVFVVARVWFNWVYYLLDGYVASDSGQVMLNRLL